MLAYERFLAQTPRKSLAASSAVRTCGDNTSKGPVLVSPFSLNSHDRDRTRAALLYLDRTCGGEIANYE